MDVRQMKDEYDTCTVRKGKQGEAECREGIEDSDGEIDNKSVLSFDHALQNHP